MRKSGLCGLGICSAAAAVALAGSANAALTFDSFSIASTGTEYGAVTNSSFMGGFFTSRTLYAQNESPQMYTEIHSYIGGGLLNVYSLGPSSDAKAASVYTRASDGDLSNFVSLSLTIACTNYTGTTLLGFTGSSDSLSSSASDTCTNYTGTKTLLLNKADFVGNLNWAQVGSFVLGFGSTTYYSGDVQVTNFNYSLVSDPGDSAPGDSAPPVPAPGAAALVGMAGLITARRRKA